MRRVGLMVMVVALVVVESVVPAGSQAQPRVSVSIRHAVPVLEVQASGTDLAAGTRVRVTISGGGGESRELFSGRVGDDFYRVLPVEPCDLGGSDLPGAQYVARIEAATGESLENPFPLFPDTAPPRFLDPTFNASPKPGDKVEAGDEIGFEVTAVEQNPPRVWQTGVHRLEVTGPRGRIGRPQQAGANAKACAAKSKSLTIQGSYRVRESDPAVIELCAVATDYVPNEKQECEKWYKGEVWEGTFTYDYSGPTLTCSTRYSVAFGVRDGEVSGGVTIETNSCPGASPGDRITGTKTGQSFSLAFFSASGARFPITIRAGNRATATFSSTPEETRVLKVHCVTCDE